MNVIKKIENFVSALEEYSNDISSGKFINEVAKECVNAIADDVDLIFRTFIEEFYASYSPKYYTRTGSLYDVYNVKANGTKISWESPYIYPGGHRLGGKALYQYVFQSGYHGGAPYGKPDADGNPHPGYMAWRLYPPNVHSQEPPYIYWGNPAAQMFPSPESRINTETTNYKNNRENITGHTPAERLREAF